MTPKKLTRLEMRIMEALWSKGQCSVREIQETFAEPRPAYTTVQTIVYRLEEKGALRCVKRISNANIFEAIITREDAQQTILNDLMSLFRGRSSMVMAHMIESGELTMDDIKDAEKALRKHLKEGKGK
jgi:predicted transcriptional regulator